SRARTSWGAVVAAARNALTSAQRVAEGSEEIREGPEPREHEGEIDAAVRRNWRGGDEVEVLELHLQSAALRHVGGEDGLRDDGRVGQIPADRVRAGEVPVRRVERRGARKVAVWFGIRRQMLPAELPAARRAPL